MGTVGLIGLGNMGTPMALNAMKAGHRLKVYDLDAGKVDRAVRSGATPAASVGEAAEAVETVLTMLPEGRHVRQVYLGADGVLAAADPGTLLIDASTIDVATARAVHGAAAKAGLAMVDAPVSGGTVGAEVATLTFMCGGEAGAVARARALLRSMGRNIVHTGGPGLGQAAKICNNMILGVTVIAVSEAFVLGRRLGLEDRTLFDIVSTSSGASWVLSNYCPVPGPVPESPANRDWEPGFMAALMAKDLGLAQAAARDTGVVAAMGAAASAIFERYVEAGQGHKDMTGIINMIGDESE